MPDHIDISVVICTHNRASSLKETLRCLREADHRSLAIEVVVIDNNSIDSTCEVVESFREQLPIRYLHEPKQGKSYALNRALDEGGLGEIIAFLDDDMSPHSDWFTGIKAICDRWPDCDYFTGHSHIIWPSDKKPAWAEDTRIRSWAFSVMGGAISDRPLPDGHWPSGNHFWIRSRSIANERRFPPIWVTEPAFILKMADEGYRGVICPDAVAGHRIQPELLNEDVIRERAIQVGRGFATVRLSHSKRTKQAVLLQKHPFLGRVFCVYSLMRWSFGYGIANLHFTKDARFAAKIVAVERLANYAHILRIARRVEKEWILENRNGKRTPKQDR